MYGGSGIAVRGDLDVDDPAPVTARLPQPHRPDLLPRAQTPRRTHERLPGTVLVHALDEKHLDRPTRGAPEVQPCRHDARVVHDDELGAEHVRYVRDRSVLDRARPRR